MNIPKFHECLRPLLLVLSRVPELQINDATDLVADHFGLTEAQRQERLPSGAQTIIRNRCGWARTDLGKAGLIERVSRGIWRITDAGRDALQRFPERMTVEDLRSYPAFKAWVDDIHARARGRQGSEADRLEPDDEQTADAQGTDEPIETERMDRDARTLRAIVEADLLERLQGMNWTRFEWLVEQLVVKLGYGSSPAEVAGALRNTGADEGIDGVIHEDRLGLGQIYLQAKRWQGTVGRPELQKFVGAMHGRAKKGVFITTSGFSAEAETYAKTLHDIRLRLVTGRELASLMVDCGLGVSEEQVYRTYRIDNDFFDESD
jgi:restriction system protein